MIIATDIPWFFWLILLVYGLGYPLADYWFGRKKRQPLRWFAWVGLIASLSLLYLQPMKETQAANGKLVLADSTASVSTLDSLIEIGYQKVSSVMEIQEVLAKQEITELALLGTGLSTAELEMLPAVPLRFFPSPLPEGIQHIQQEEAIEGSPFSVAGTLLINNPTKLVFESPSGKKQEVKITPEMPDFRFTETSSTHGNFLYSFTAIREADTLFSEVLPVQVAKKQPLKILLITGFPTYETRQLKQQLIDWEYEVAVRQILSKGVFHEEYINTERTSFSRFTADKLTDIRLLIVDEPYWEQLTSSERTAVEGLIQQGSLGMLFLGEAGKLKKLTENAKTKQQKAELSFSDGETPVLLKAETAIFTEKLLTYSGQTVGGVHALGFGQIGVPVFSESYRLGLSGRKEDYARLWQEMLLPLSGRTLSTSSLRISGLPVAREAVEVQLQTNAKTPTLFANGEEIRLKSDYLRSGNFSGTYWPESRGWHTLTSSADSLEKSFFVFSPEEWKTQRMSKLQQQTQLIANNSGKEIQSRTRTNYIPISPWIGWSFSLLFMGILWLEQRLSGR